MKSRRRAKRRRRGVHDSVVSHSDDGGLLCANVVNENGNSEVGDEESEESEESEEKSYVELLKVLGHVEEIDEDGEDETGEVHEEGGEDDFEEIEEVEELVEEEPEEEKRDVFSQIYGGEVDISGEEIRSIPVRCAFPQCNRFSLPKNITNTQTEVPHEEAMASVLSSYTDILSRDTDMKCVIHHLVGHVLRSRRIVLRNTRNSSSRRDEGFTQTRVLVLVPFRNVAYDFLRGIIDAVIKEREGKTVAHKRRMEEEFGPSREEVERNMKKPESWHKVFAGNADDCFVVGVRVSSAGRTPIRLFAPLMKSDIIVASPLGLKMRKGDFLSSLEICVFWSAGICCYFQNEEHIWSAFERMNTIPKEVPDNVDFSRVKTWHLDGKGSEYRQTIITSSVESAVLRGLVTRYCNNRRGCVSVGVECEVGAVISCGRMDVTQVFRKVDCISYKSSANDRFKYFCDNIFPSFVDSRAPSGILMFVPSYLDGVRVRNFLRSTTASFVLMSEYATKEEMTSARSEFFHRRVRVMILTERMHFFRRYRIKGVRNVVFYGPPKYSEFYEEMLSWLPHSSDEVSQPSSVLLYSKYDGYEMENILGSERAKRMLTSQKTMHRIGEGY